VSHCHEGSGRPAHINETVSALVAYFKQMKFKVMYGDEVVLALSV